MIIAEIGQAHDGSLGSAHAYIDALVGSGVDAIKFQTHIAAAESSIHEPFRVKFSLQDETRMAYWKRMEFTIEQWRGLKNHCEDNEFMFISSPFSLAAVDLLENIGANTYKIGSGEVSNWLMLDKIAATGKPIILSSGMSSIKELEETLAFLKPFGNPLSILQCTTAYPTMPDQWGLNVIPILKQKFNLPIGFSDHSGNIYACMAAAALGAEIFEFHVVFNKRQFGPDSPASIAVDQVRQMTEGIKSIQTSMQTPVDKSDSQKYSGLKNMFGKSLAVNKFLSKGHLITKSDLESKKPGEMGIPAKDFESVLGRKLNVDLQQWDFLKKSHLDN